MRFAPSPTGPLHIGGVRTALYNYLFARQHGGDLIFRIEDTDSGRFVPGAEEYIIESFKWLGIKFDEGVSFGGDKGPYRQSERRDIYRRYVKQLLDGGHAYLAFDTPEELNAKRAEIENFQYDASTRMSMRNSLSMSKEEVDALLASGAQYVVRFKVTPGEDVHVDDIIRGDVTINSSIIDDKVLYRAFGWADTQPRFAHLPLLLKPVGNGKLSKRDGDKLGFPVFPLEWHDPVSGEVSSGYREKGYLPEAVVNFLALLGWNPGEGHDELMSLDEMVQLFDLSKCSKNGAKFDYVKAAWFNHQYLIRRSDEEWVPAFDKLLREQGVSATARQETEVVRMMKSKVIEYVDGENNKKKRNISFVSDLWPLTEFFFRAPVSFDREDKVGRNLLPTR